MEHYHEEVLVEAPVEHVWAFYCDTSHWHDWMPRGTASDFSGPIDQVGTTYVATMGLMGFEMKATYTVVEVEPLRLYHETSDYGSMENFMRFAPEGGATRVTLEGEFTMPAHMPGFIKNLMTTHWMERQTRQMLQDFKALAEATVPVPA
jgi:uncharacterized membrane protein